MTLKYKDLNEYIKDKPDAIEAIFSNLFGKHLMRYYPGNKEYAVSFHPSIPTSYNDEKTKRIVIAMSNVRDLLNMNIPVLGVAYHEMAHTLYTKNIKRNHILDKVIKNNSKTLHYSDAKNIWNVLEDEYIERRLKREYPFLEKYIKDLKEIIEEDGLLMSWRKGRTENAPKELVELAEEFANKRLTNKRSAEIIATIAKKWYGFENEVIKRKPLKNKSKRMKKGHGHDGQETQQETQSEKPKEEEGFDEDEWEKLEGDSVLKEILKNKEKEKMEQEIVKDFQRAQHSKSGQEISKISKGYNLKNQKIKKFYNAKHFIDGGKTRAQGKGYTMVANHRVSVPRIIESKANKKPPKVFYGKSKDISFFKKVVVFEDVSGSTLNHYETSHVFSNIAKTLVDAFDGSEWWLYGAQLHLKNKKDYEYNSFPLIRGVSNQMHSQTNAHLIVQAMRYYKSTKGENNIYVIITDGDLRKLIYDQKELFEEFKDKTAIVGILDPMITKHSTYYLNFEQSKNIKILNKQLPSGFALNSLDRLLARGNKYVQALIVESVKKTIEIIKERIV